MKVLETERLSLRRITVGDAEVMLEVLNEPAFIRFVADRNVRTISQAEEFIAVKMLPSYTQFGFGFYLVELKQSGIPVGICGLIKRDTLEDVDIGFSILRRFWRQGYAYEAARAVMAYGKREFGLPRLVGITSPDNENSGKLLEKLGLRFERMVHVPGFGEESRLFV